MYNREMNSYLVVSKKDMQDRGWNQLDIILISGDAYVDHHSFGTSLIGRFLESKGYRVGIIAQPDCDNPESFMTLGRPRLFFGISSGSVDSMVANYTANKRLRSDDAFSPDNKAGNRPDRALIRYSNTARRAYKDVIVVLGGIEASLRRLAHYDYWSDKVRRSVLLDAKADILVYGMGERAILEIAENLNAGNLVDTKYNKRYFDCLDNIAGTVIVRPEYTDKDKVVLPSFASVSKDKEEFTKAFNLIYKNQDPFSAKVIVEPNVDRVLIHNKPALPLTTEELDDIYALSFTRKKHPMYKKHLIKAETMISNSIVSHRGCPGQCNFCGLYFHQGRIVQSRSKDSLLREAEALTKSSLFRGTITDVGGPSANLYMAECSKWSGVGACSDRQCMMPSKCNSLKLGYDKQMELLRAIRQVSGVKHVFISSGIRYDLVVDDKSDKYLKYICENHISGQMKVAPEHLSENTLKYMNKPAPSVYYKFIERFNKVTSKLKKKLFLVNYFICSHPGSTLKDAQIIKDYMRTKKHVPEQVQDYLPLPMTASGVMYYTGKDPFTGKSISCLKNPSQRKEYRAIIQSK